MSLFESIKKSARFKDCSADEDVLKIVGQLETTAGKVDALEAENAALKKKNEDFETKAKEEAAEAKKALLDAAEADGRIDAVSRPAYQALLDSDFEAGKKTMDALKPKRRAMKDVLVDPSGDESPWEKRIKEIKDRLKK